MSSASKCSAQNHVVKEPTRKCLPWKVGTFLKSESQEMEPRTNGILIHENFHLKFRLLRFTLYARAKRFPPQDPYFLKNGQINRVTNFSSTFGPTESDSEKKWVVTLILGEETGFEIAYIGYITN